jgi:hypothetical protein
LPPSIRGTGFTIFPNPRPVFMKRGIALSPPTKESAVTLAGRVSERLFCPNFNLIAGLEEMIYANLMLMWCSGIRSGSKDFMEFHRLWSYVLQRVEATLRTHEGAVRAIADVLMREEVIRDPQLQTLLTGVSKWQGEVVIDPDAALIRDPLEELH